MDAIFERTSVREYSKKPIKKKTIKKLLMAAMAAPSAGNQQPWEFIVVDNRDLLQKLMCYSPYSKPVGKSQVSIVLLMRTNGLRFGALAQQDMAACAENILLEATELGLGSVWQCAYPEASRMQYITELFDLPANLVPYAVISLGYPKKGKLPKQQNRFDKKRINWNGFKAAKGVDADKNEAEEQVETVMDIESSEIPGIKATAVAEKQTDASQAAPVDSQAKDTSTGWRSATNAAQ